MNISSVQVGDLVEVDKRGRVFVAEVEAKNSRELGIRPLRHGESFRHAEAREVTKWWRRMGRPRPHAKVAG